MQHNAKRQFIYDIITKASTMLHSLVPRDTKCLLDGLNCCQSDDFPDTVKWPDISPTIDQLSDISLTAVKFPDISRFSKSVHHVQCCVNAWLQKFLQWVLHHRITDSEEDSTTVGAVLMSN